MSAKSNSASVVSFRRRNHGMDEALKAGIGASVCSVLILAIVLLAMHTLQTSVG